MLPRASVPSVVQRIVITQRNGTTRTASTMRSSTTTKKFAIVQPPRGISGDEAALARFPAHEQRLLEARDLFGAIDAHPYEDSDEDGEPPQQMTGYFPPWENEIYLNLLNKYGQPLQENHRAVTAFQQEFNYRVWSSVTAHPNKFNGGQTTHKTGPRGGKIRSTVYRDWVEANGGKWVGFQWKLLDSA